MSQREENADELEENQLKRSKTRRDIEDLLGRIGISLDGRINVVDLDSGDKYYFDSYPDALDFMKGKKGRWYVTRPAIKYIPRDRKKN